MTKAFIWVSNLEAVSFLLLLFIAMPLKYFFDMPEYVKSVGMAHGILFVLYIIGAYVMYEKLNWKVKDMLMVMFCAVLPFGPFYAHKKYIQPYTDQ